MVKVREQVCASRHLHQALVFSTETTTNFVLLGLAQLSWSFSCLVWPPSTCMNWTEMIDY